METLVCFFDTETTGIPLWTEPSETEGQPHIVQLAGLLVNENTQKVIQSMDVIIKPDGWVIPPETIKIHNITNEFALDVGVHEKSALSLFLWMCGQNLRISFNTTFDNRIIRIAIKRYYDDLAADKWKDGPYACMMQAAKQLIAGRYLKLEVVYQQLFNREHENPHTAMGDAKACMDIYFELKKKGIVVS